MPLPRVLNRRNFLMDACASASALGIGAFLGQQLFADRTQIAARIDEAPQSHPLIPALKMATESLVTMESIHDYRATFVKRELIDRQMKESRMELKLRERPFSVYLKFLQPNAGREAIFVEGQNNGKLLVHDVGLAGLVGTISLDPTGSYAMAENRYPVTMIGMRNLVAAVLEQWLTETKVDDLTVNFYPNARIGKVSCKAIETAHAAPRPEAKFQMTRLYLDNQQGIPIRVQQYSFPSRREMQPALVEDYLYTDLHLNTGLADIDFSVKNPKYRF